MAATTKNPAHRAGFFNKSKFLVVFNQFEVFHKLRGVNAFAEISHRAIIADGMESLY